MVLGYRHGEGRKFFGPRITLHDGIFAGKTMQEGLAWLDHFAGRTGLHMRQQTDLWMFYFSSQLVFRPAGAAA